MSRTRLYFGKSGQMAVMSEFLVRGWNVAVPEVDVGDDIFVVRDDDFDASRIQVKAAHGKATQAGYSARYSLPLRQLLRPIRPELYYVFAVRFETQWADFVIISRTELSRLHVTQGLGTLSGPKGGTKDKVVLTFSFRSNEVVCSKVNIQQYRNNWSPWPVVSHE